MSDVQGRPGGCRFPFMAFESNRFRPLPEHDESPPPILIGSVWMAGLALVLSMLPLPGAFVGGLVGGSLVGTAGRALAASLVAAVLYGLLVRFIPYAGVFRLPGAPTETTIVAPGVAMVLGALVAGAFVKSRKGRSRRMI